MNRNNLNCLICFITTNIASENIINIIQIVDSFPTWPSLVLKHKRNKLLKFGQKQLIRNLLNLRCAEFPIVSIYQIRCGGAKWFKSQNFIFVGNKKNYPIFTKKSNFLLENLHDKRGRFARWRKWRACDVGEAKEWLENELWGRWSNGRVGEWAVT